MITKIQNQFLELQKEILGGNLAGVLTRFADLILVAPATADLLEQARTQGHEFEILAKPVHPQDLLAQLRN